MMSVTLTLNLYKPFEVGSVLNIYLFLYIYFYFKLSNYLYIQFKLL
jgi:hypothetical protein